jgi:hypothetical protein
MKKMSRSRKQKYKRWLAYALAILLALTLLIGTFAQFIIFW